MTFLHSSTDPKDRGGSEERKCGYCDWNTPSAVEGCGI